MADLTARVTVDLAGNLERRAPRFGQALNRFARSGRRGLALLGRGVAAVDRRLDRFGNRFTAFATGAGGVGALRFMKNLDARFRQLAVNAELTEVQMNALKREIFDIAQQPDLRIDPSGLTSGIEEILARTGDLELATGNLRNIALLMAATGAAGRDAGALIADIAQKFNVTDAAEILSVLDTLARQGKAGAFELGDLATQGAEVAAAFAATKRQGAGAVREMGALLQVVRRGSGSAAEAATAFDRLISSIVGEKAGELQKRGIQIFDPEKLKQGLQVARPISDIIKEIIRATDGKETLLQKVFDQRAIRALRPFANEFAQTGAFDSLDELLATVGDGSRLMQDATFKAQGFDAAMTSLATAFKSFADAKLAEPIQDLANAINRLDPDRLQEILNAALITGAGAGALILGSKTFKAGRNIRSNLFGPRSAKGFAGAGLAPVPVFVTNFPGVPGAAGAAGRKRGGGAGRSRIGRFARGSGVAGAAALGLVEIGRGALQPGLSPLERGRATGGGTGILAGAGGGALLGSIGGPPGMFIGSLAGGAIGFITGEQIGEEIARAIKDALGDQDQRVTIEVRGLPAGASIDADPDAGFLNDPIGP